MALGTVNAYNISVWLHITAAVVGFGSTFALAVAFPLAANLHPRHLPFAHRLSRAIAQYLTGPALLVVLVTGIYQTADGDWGFGDFWISATFAILIALGALNGAYFIPTDRRLEAMLERELAAGAGGEVALSDAYQRAARTETMIGTLAGVLVILAVFLMVTKPGA